MVVDIIIRDSNNRQTVLCKKRCALLIVLHPIISKML